MFRAPLSSDAYGGAYAAYRYLSILVLAFFRYVSEEPFLAHAFGWFLVHQGSGRVVCGKYVHAASTSLYLDLKHIVSMQVIAVYTAQTALFKTINLFAPEKALVRAERTKGSYGAAPYFLSKVLADLPIAALYPLVFSSIVYPMANLQPKVLSHMCLLFTLSSWWAGQFASGVVPRMYHVGTGET